MSFSRRCRLCLSNNSSNVCVFSKSRANQNLQDKVFKLFSVMMTPNDSYPNYLCKSCIPQLETFHRFALAVEATQQEIQKILLVNNAPNVLDATNSVPVLVPFFQIVVPNAEYTASDSCLTAPRVTDVTLIACEEEEVEEEVKMEPPDEDPLNTEHLHYDQSVLGMEKEADDNLNIDNRIEFVNVDSIFMETSVEDSQSNLVQNKEINIARINTHLQNALNVPSHTLTTESSDSDTGSYTSDITSSHYTESEAAVTNIGVSYAFDSETRNAVSTTTGTKSPLGANLTLSNLKLNLKNALAKVQNIDSPNSTDTSPVFIPEDDSGIPVFWSYEDSLLPLPMTKLHIELSRNKLHGIDAVYDFTCHNCRIKFLHYKNLSLHCLHQHGKAAVVSCCNVDMSTYQRLLNHMVQHERDNWKCSTCGVECVTRNKFTSHAVTHSQQKETNFNCKKCHRIFYDLSTLQEHMKTKFHRGDAPKTVYLTHSQQKETNFNCKKCDKIFCDLSMLKEHMKTTFHQGDPPKTGYLTHSQQTHSQQKETNFNCKKCHRIFYDLSTLQEHMTTTYHRGDPPKTGYRYTCDVCSHKLRSKRTFKAHWARIHAPKIYACSVCTMRFGSKLNLKNHTIARHLNTIPVMCPICDRKFKVMSKLKIHMIMHKKWQCQKCPNAFPNAIRLAEHRRRVHQIYGEM